MSINGCACPQCGGPPIDGVVYGCRVEGCGDYVTQPGFACHLHLTKSRMCESHSCQIYVSIGYRYCNQHRKGSTMPVSANDSATYANFHVFCDGSLQFNCATLDAAKEKAQELIRARKLSVFIYEAILKVTPKPVETVETDLRAPAVTPVVPA